MIEPWHIYLFGGLRAVQGNRVVSRFRTQKTAALLAYLAYNLGRSHTRDLLIEMLWPESELESGRHSLSLALSSLRHQLEPPGVAAGTVIVADRYSVELNPEATHTDVQAFERALRTASQARNSPTYSTLLTQAVESYGGSLLPGFYEDWITGEQERLADRFHQATLQLAGVLEKSGELERAVETLQRAASLDPVREETVRELIRLLAASGHPETAVRRFRELEDALERDLSEEPSSTTRALVQEIERQTAPAVTNKTPRRVAGDQPGVKPAEALPEGTVTFLLTDIEGSTALWERAGDAYRQALSIHHAVIRREVRRNGGHEVKEAGDSFVIAFASAGDALACAVACQRALAGQPWPSLPVSSPPSPNLGGDTLKMRVRMALHTGDVEMDESAYQGLMLHHASRMLNAAHGGQILCSEATSALLRRDLEPGIHLKPLGTFKLRDVETHERLSQVCYQDMPTRDFPPLLAEPALAARLPLQFTRFFGREQEISALAEMLELESGNRLVTLTGLGGTGKTRLAIEVAGRVAQSFEGGVWFVQLSEIENPALISGAILESLGVPRSASQSTEDHVVEALQRGPCLLVLDNFEQLAGDGSEVVMNLLERVPTLRCLITSRQVLGLTGEREFTVPPLATPGGGRTFSPEGLSLYESVRLFVDRAQAVKPDFRVTNNNAAAVAELCDRLEGIPLALELAAARALVMTPGQMLAQLANRFEFLVSRRRGVVERQRTLRAAVDWSFRLLSPELQEFFCKLSVFRGGWNVDAAEAVCDEQLAIDFLAQLRECSLVLTEESESEIRFRMLESLREYAEERLTPELREGAHQRHAAWMAGFAERGARELVRPNEREWLDRLEHEHANARAAIVFSTEYRVPSTESSSSTEYRVPSTEISSQELRDPRQSAINHQLSTGLRIAAALGRFWSIRGYAREARPLVESLLARANGGTDLRLRASALDTIGSLAHDMGDFEAAVGALDKSLAAWRDLGEAAHLAYALNLRANVALDQQNEEEAEPLYQEALRVYRELGDKRGIGMVLSNLSVVALQKGEDERAANLMEESLKLKRGLGNLYGLAISLENLGNLQRRLGDLTRSRELHEEALSIRRELGHKQGVAMSLNNLGHVLLGLSELDAAAKHLSESIALFHELGDLRGLAEGLAGAAGVLFARGKHELGAIVMGAAQGLIVEIGAERATETGRLATETRETMGEKKFEKALSVGRAWTLEEAVERAINYLTEDLAN